MEKFSNIQAVTFDVGGTLIEPWPSIGHVYAEVASRYHPKQTFAPELLNRRFDDAWQAQLPFDLSREGWARIVDQTFAGLCDPPPSRTFFPALYERFSEAGAWRVFDDVLPTLEGLASRGLRLAVISNWDERLRPLLQQLKLDRYFEAIVVSCETGAVKPSAIVFETAARLLDLAPSQILHIGDSLNADVNGARNAGLRAVHLDRSGSAPGGACVLSLRDLAPWLG